MVSVVELVVTGLLDELVLTLVSVVAVVSVLAVAPALVVDVL